MTTDPTPRALRIKRAGALGVILAGALAVTACFPPPGSSHPTTTTTTTLAPPTTEAPTTTAAPTTTSTVPAGVHVTVSPSTGVNGAGDTLTVSGTGFTPADNLNGVYVALGTGFAPQNLDMANAIWVHPGGAGPAQAALNSDGTFSVSLAVASSFAGIDCTVTSCSVVTFSAHTGSYAPWATMTPVSFA
jgi:hypothetical protein